MSSHVRALEANEQRRPRVFVIDRPIFTDGFDAFLLSADTDMRRDPAATDAELLIEAAGRLCYMSFGEKQSPKTNREYITHLIYQGHHSVLEHASWSFILTNVSRAFTHQLVRHRIGFSFSQLSQQYHDESEAEFVVPDAITQHPTAFAMWEHATQRSRDAYRSIRSELSELIDRSQNQSEKRELLRAMRSAARSVLPNATETKIFVTANARALRHFFSSRGAIEGDEEMRIVSATLFGSIEPDAPSVFADFQVQHLSDGSPTLVQVALD